MLGRVSLVLTLLLGLLPYVNTVKLPPIASFWAEWISVIVAIAWLASLRSAHGKGGYGASATPARSLVDVPYGAMAGAAFCAVLLLQCMQRVPISFGAPLLAIGCVCLAGVMCLAGAGLRQSGDNGRVLDAWALGLVLALALNFAAVLLDRQGLFFYGWRLGPRPIQPRADGLVGQPNQLAVFAVLAGAAAHYLWLRGRMHWSLHLIVSAVVAFVLSATASRAGWLIVASALLLNAVAMRGHVLRRQGWMLLTASVAFLVIAQMMLPLHGEADARLAYGDVGRIELWRDSIQLIAMHPWAGVGFGNIMGARWMELTTSIFEPNAAHAHNLIAQLAVELGLPAALLILALLGLVLWGALRSTTRRGVAPEHLLPGSVVLVLFAYSMAEFPLWQTYFLLPFGLMAGLVDQPAWRMRISTVSDGARRAGWACACALCVLLAWDYHRSEVIYASLMAQNQAKGHATAVISIQDASDVALLTAFDQQGNVMYARTLDMDGQFVEEKLEVSRRAMMSLTGRETIARRVAFLAVAGHTDEARELMLRTRRNKTLEQDTLETLELFTAKYPDLREFIAQLPRSSRPGTDKVLAARR